MWTTSFLLMYVAWQPIQSNNTFCLARFRNWPLYLDSTIHCIALEKDGFDRKRKYAMTGLIILSMAQHAVLTHWGRVTHICINKLTIIGSDNGLSPGRCQAIIWTNAGILLIRTLGTNFSEILGEIHSFSFSKTHLKMSSAKWRLFCPGLNVLTKMVRGPQSRLKTKAYGLGFVPTWVSRAMFYIAWEAMIKTYIIKWGTIFDLKFSWRSGWVSEHRQNTTKLAIIHDELCSHEKCEAFGVYAKESVATGPIQSTTSLRILGSPISHSFLRHTKISGKSWGAHQVKDVTPSCMPW